MYRVPRPDQAAVAAWNREVTSFDFPGGYEMKIKYEFANEVIEIEVSDDWGEIVIELDRQEKLNDRKETRRHEQLDLALDESPWLKSDEELPDEIVARKLEEGARLRRAMNHLSEKQMDVIKEVYYRGYGITEYARMRGIAHSTASERLRSAEKVLKKFF